MYKKIFFSTDVSLTNIDVHVLHTHTVINGEFEFPLLHCLSNAFAIACIPSWSGTALTIIYQATYLTMSWVTTVILSRTKTIHLALRWCRRRQLCCRWIQARLHRAGFEGAAFLFHSGKKNDNDGKLSITRAPSKVQWFFFTSRLLSYLYPLLHLISFEEIIQGMLSPQNRRQVHEDKLKNIILYNSFIKDMIGKN